MSPLNMGSERKQGSGDSDTAENHASGVPTYLDEEQRCRCTRRLRSLKHHGLRRLTRWSTALCRMHTGHMRLIQTLRRNHQ